MATFRRIFSGVLLIAFILTAHEASAVIQRNAWEWYYPPKSVQEGNEPFGVQVIQAQLEDSACLKCPPASKLHIIDASFGNLSVHNAQIYKGEDDAPQSVDIVKNLCENKQECSIKASFDTFMIDGALSPEHSSLAVRYICNKQSSSFLLAKDLRAAPISGASWDLRYNFGIHELYPSTVANENYETLSKQYVTLQDFGADCGSPITSFGELHSIEEAKGKCSDEPSCTFFIYKPMKATLCSSPSYESPRKQTGSSVYVKANAFADQDFHITPNSQGICERDQRVAEVADVLSVDEAAEYCKTNSDCTFFVLSTVNGLTGAKNRFRNHLWMCKGAPVQIPHDGFIFGQKISSMFERPEGEQRRPRPYNNLITSPGLKGHNGPLSLE